MNPSSRPNNSPREKKKCHKSDNCDILDIFPNSIISLRGFSADVARLPLPATPRRLDFGAARPAAAELQGRECSGRDQGPRACGPFAQKDGPAYRGEAFAAPEQSPPVAGASCAHFCALPGKPSECRLGNCLPRGPLLGITETYTDAHARTSRVRWLAGRARGHCSAAHSCASLQRRQTTCTRRPRSPVSALEGRQMRRKWPVALGAVLLRNSFRGA